MVNVKKYNSFFLAIFVFNGLFNVSSLIFGYGSSVNYIIYSILFSIFVILNAFNNERSKNRALMLLFLLCLFVLMGYLLSYISNIYSRDNEVFLLYIFIYSIIPICILCKEFDDVFFHKVLCVIIPVNLFLLLLVVVLRHELFFSGTISYMSVGMWLSPGFLFSYYYYYIEKDKLMLVWLLLSAVMLFTSANRFILVVTMFSILAIYLSAVKINFSFLVKSISFCCLILFVLINIVEILVYSLDLMGSLGVYAMGIQRLLDSLSSLSDGQSVLSGREMFYKYTYDLIINHPFGLGPIHGNNMLSLYIEDSIDSVILAYPHNFFLEVFLHLGIFLGVLFILFCMWVAVQNFIYRSVLGSRFYFYLIMSCLSMSLLTSSSYLFFSPFWISLALGVNNIAKARF